MSLILQASILALLLLLLPNNSLILLDISLILSIQWVINCCWSFSSWGFTMRCSRGKWMWFWSSWGTRGHRDTHTFPLACSTWFAVAPPLGGQRARGVLLHGTRAFGRECDTWCLPSQPQNLQSLLLSETLMDWHQSHNTLYTDVWRKSQVSVVCIQNVSITQIKSRERWEFSFKIMFIYP